MTLICDAAPLVAMADRTSELGATCHRLLVEEPGDIILPAFVAAEAGYLIARRLGADAERAFLEDLASGVYRIEALHAQEFDMVLEVDRETPGLGLADLSIVVLADRYGTDRLLTFDQRDFRRVRRRRGGPFRLLPADA